MRITAVETIRVRADLEPPRGPSVFTYHLRETLFVKLTTDAGVVGWGETYAMPGVEAAIRDGLAPLLVGADLLSSRARHADFRRATFDNGFAVGGVDIALADAAARSLGVPLHVLYGGAVRDQVQAYASLPGYYEDRAPEDHWLDEAQALVQRGFGAMKFRIGRDSPPHEATILESIRLALGDAVKLMADANAAYSATQARRIAPALRDLDFDWFEEPLPQSGYLGYPELRSKLELPLAGGEGLQGRTAAHGTLQRGCFDIIQPDVSICGGIGEVVFVGQLAQMSGVRCIPHCWGGAVMLAATLQACSILPEATRLTGNEAPILEFDVTDNPFRTEVCHGDPFSLSNGAVRVPTGPGLGIELDEAALRRYAHSG